MKKTGSKKGRKKCNYKAKIKTILGVVVLGAVLIYAMYYYFVKNNNIKINMSTDKKIEYVTIAGSEELLSTQKFVSDLEYSMRYDINKVKVFKYKQQDIYKFLEDSHMFVIVEKGSFPNKCATSNLDISYYNCSIDVDQNTTEYYIATNGLIYKVTIKHLEKANYNAETYDRITYMLNSFAIMF